MNSDPMPPGPKAIRYGSLEALTEDLAARVAATLASAIAARGAASLVVSGGRSPVRLFQRLQAATIDWSRVFVALADERWVPATDAASNEKLVRDELLRGAAKAAHFQGLKNAAPSPAAGAAIAWGTFADVPRPFDVVLLGMGDDGHTASLFPESPNLAAALDTTLSPGCIGMQAPTPPEARLSLNLSALLASRRIMILITGDSKWTTYLAATQHGDIVEMPVRAVLRQRQVPVDVIWSP